jgi:hypothetical protein
MSVNRPVLEYEYKLPPSNIDCHLTADQRDHANWNATPQQRVCDAIHKYVGSSTNCPLALSARGRRTYRVPIRVTHPADRYLFADRIIFDLM